MKKYKVIPVIFLAIILFINIFTLIVYADELREGSVKGLPEKLVVLDDNGKSVNENGDYFFNVEGMNQGELYTKKVQIMNLREDTSYDISFMAQPLDKSGEIDLEEECDCEIFVDDGLIYKGKVTGEGNPDIRNNAVTLGTYEPGESHSMRIDIIWRGPSADNSIDEGAKLVDSSGTTVIRDPSGKRHIEGEIRFKWAFYAEVKDIEESDITISRDPQPEESSVPPLTPGFPGVIKTGETIAFIAIGLVMFATLFLIILLVKRKKDKKDKH